MNDLADIEPVTEEVIERTAAKGHPTRCLSLGIGAKLTRNLMPSEIVSELTDTAKPQILAEDLTDGFGLGLIDDQATIDPVIAERDAASHPHALSSMASSFKDRHIDALVGQTVKRTEMQKAELK